MTNQAAPGQRLTQLRDHVQAEALAAYREVGFDSTLQREGDQ
ncbi:hypothetical protein [Streptomyces sp. NPDC051219]